jgi:hypothetical protein
MTAAAKTAIAALALGASAFASAQQPMSLEESFRVTLGAAGLDTETARFDESILPFYRQGEFTTPFFLAAHANVWRTPFLMTNHKRQLYVAADRPIEVISTASRMLGDGTRRELLGNPIAAALDRSKDPDAFTKALQRMERAGLIKGPIPAVDQVPKEVQQAAALLIEVSMDAEPYRKAAFAQLTDLDGDYRRETSTLPTNDDPENYQKLLAFYRKVEMNYLYAAAQEIASASTEARRIIGVAGQSASYQWQMDSVWGVIRLTGSNANDHDLAPTFLQIDTGGDDTYINPASNRSSTNWMSICIDTVGNDKYLSHPALKDTKIADWPDRARHRGQPGPASAAFGISVLSDASGNDLYRTARMGIGAAVFGCAMLLDFDGDDTYDAYADSIGFGKFGVGLVDDAKGTDTYTGFNQVQGCGLTRGAGLLIDRGGDDIYAANDQIIDFPSAQSAEHNDSFAQGAGYGVRSDYLTGRSQSGGVGILYDVAGADKYSCGVFGQGTGYWDGSGMLWDDDGDDTYNGVWYVQGAAAHFGIGYLEDAKGKDTYRASMNMAMGAGHDFALGMLIDRLGDDDYIGPNLSMGAGNSNGIGVFADCAGSDKYAGTGLSIGQASEGQAGSLRETALCLGVFIDLFGVDTYAPGKPYAQNAQRVVNWRIKQELPRESQLGIFWDR